MVKIKLPLLLLLVIPLFIFLLNAKRPNQSPVVTSFV